ncbi:MAG: GDP-mannose 4,6-dehydratase [Bacteroidales bacterium]|nr:GDP-mannose 4,6-dehydratase [Bacteroidales bacterium]
MRILITGITGFVGGHLVETLTAEGGHTLFGLCRQGRWPSALSHLAGAATLHAAELLDDRAVENVLRATQPEWIFHLAGYANTGKSFREPALCWRDNLDATRAFYDAVIRAGQRPRILFASTGLIYGEPDAPGTPCTEFTTLKPASPYAASKAAADLLSYQYTRSAGLDIVRVRLFNQIGPRQPADYAIPNFARQIAAIEAGTLPPILTTGNLSAHRDFTDIRDMTRAFRLLIARGTSGEAYNAGHGDTWQIQDVLNRLLELSPVPITVEQSLPSGRKGDTAITRADPQKLKAATGWEPAYGMDQTLRDVLSWWREMMAGSARDNHQNKF